MTLLDAPSLRTAAVTLTADSRRLLDQVSFLGREWEDIPAAGFAGDAATATIVRLHHLTTPLSVPAGQMHEVADVLDVAAALQADLDEAVARAIEVADRFTDTAPLVTLLLRDLRGLGDLLDFTCARQIDLLCTQLTPGPVRRLGDAGELSVDAIHELALLDASPEIATLAAEHPDLRLLETSDGHLVAAVGPLDTAASVTTIVAGVGSSDPQGWPTQIHRARSVAAATGGATVLWLGYTAPSSLAHGVPRSVAEHAAPHLRQFQADLAARHPGQHRTVVAWSYGSVVAGEAAGGAASTRGLHADDLVLVGSPGVGVNHASDLQLIGEEPQVHAVTNPRDPIGLVTTPIDGIHGKDPTSPEFGARVWTGDPTGGHSSYWEDPEFLANLGALARD